MYLESTRGKNITRTISSDNIGKIIWTYEGQAKKIQISKVLNHANIEVIAETSIWKRTTTGALPVSW